LSIIYINFSHQISTLISGRYLWSFRIFHQSTYISCWNLYWIIGWNISFFQI